MSFFREIFTLLLAVTTAFLALPAQAAPHALQLVYPAPSEQQELVEPVQVEFALEGKDLHTRFVVRSKQINVKEQLAANEYPYQFDVVEVFVSVAGLRGAQGPFPYFEFELSPFDQTFAVRIDSLKKPFHDGIDVGLRHEVTRTADGWVGEMWIPLDRLGWDGRVEKVVGNAYAILGPHGGGREYWSLTLPPLKKPNFHQPKFFRPLLPSTP